MGWILPLSDCRTKLEVGAIAASMMQMQPLDHYRVNPGTRINLQQFKTWDDGGWSKAEGKAEFKRLQKRLRQLQELLYAESKQALLVIFQAIDTGGKDSTIRRVFQGVNPQGCQVTSFKAPSELELQHDFLWRVHTHVPRQGYIGIFSRSHYEDVLVVRVKNLVPESRWRSRYEHINAFEQMLHDEGVTLLKFFLHISKDYQKQRLQRRLDNPEKRWKFNRADLVERQRWDSYQFAFEEMLNRCSTPLAPWYVIPAERRWYRDLLVVRTLVDTLESWQMSYPALSFDPAKLVID